DDPDGAGGLLSKAILGRAAADRPSHIFFFSHGWKGDLDSARDQYDRWIKAMLDRTDDRNGMPGAFHPMWVGLHWPSLPFGDEELARNDFAADEESLSPAALEALYVDRLGLNSADAHLLKTIVQAHQKNAAARELP